MKTGAPTFQNPVLDLDAPDPSVLRAADGSFYGFVTNGVGPDGSFLRTPVMRSRDLVTWEHAGDAMPQRPTWMAEGGWTWAPHAVRATVDGKDQYRLYFSGKREDTGGFGIGVAVSDKPEGPYVPDAAPIVSGPSYEVIDPFVFTDRDRRSYLYWGSAFQPIRGQELAADGRTLLGTATEVLRPSDAFDGHARLVEGFWLTQRGDSYVATFSGDNTHNAHYAVMSARSSSPLGTFEYQGTKPVLADNAHFAGPGHNAVVQDDAGQDWMLYHAYKGEDRSKRVLMLDRIQWHGDLPVVNAGAGPAGTPQPAPALDAHRGAQLAAAAPAAP